MQVRFCKETFGLRLHSSHWKNPEVFCSRQVTAAGIKAIRAWLYKSHDSFGNLVMRAAFQHRDFLLPSRAKPNGETDTQRDSDEREGEWVGEGAKASSLYPGEPKDRPGYLTSWMFVVVPPCFYKSILKQTWARASFPAHRRLLLLLLVLLTPLTEPVAHWLINITLKICFWFFIFWLIM